MDTATSNLRSILLLLSFCLLGAAVAARAQAQTPKLSKSCAQLSRDIADGKALSDQLNQLDPSMAHVQNQASWEEVFKQGSAIGLRLAGVQGTMQRHIRGCHDEAVTMDAGQWLAKFDAADAAFDSAANKGRVSFKEAADESAQEMYQERMKPYRDLLEAAYKEGGEREALNVTLLLLGLTQSASAAAVTPSAGFQTIPVVPSRVEQEPYWPTGWRPIYPLPEPPPPQPYVVIRPQVPDWRNYAPAPRTTCVAQPTPLNGGVIARCN